MKIPDVHINICENDPYGNRRGRVVAISFTLPHYDQLFNIEAVDSLNGEAIITTDKTILLYNCQVQHNGCTEWAGNMLWNMYAVPLNFALGLINIFPAYQKKWNWLDGCTAIYRKWQQNQLITAQDFGCSYQVQPEIINLNQLSLF